MAENDQEAIRRGFLYYWANDPRVETETPTVMVVPCEVYSRIVGYVRPVQNWNVGKKQEFADRQVYDVPEVKP